MPQARRFNELGVTTDETLATARAHRQLVRNTNARGLSADVRRSPPPAAADASPPRAMSPRPERTHPRPRLALHPPSAAPGARGTARDRARGHASLAPGLDHEVAHARLAWWREELARAARGEAAAPAHAQPAGRLSWRGAGVLAELRGLADAATWDLAGATFETRRELEAYSARWSAALIAPLAFLASRLAGHAQCSPSAAACASLSCCENLVPDARPGACASPWMSSSTPSCARRRFPACRGLPRSALRGRQAAAGTSRPGRIRRGAPVRRAARRCAAFWYGRRCCTQRARGLPQCDPRRRPSRRAGWLARLARRAPRGCRTACSWATD